MLANQSTLQVAADKERCSNSPVTLDVVESPVRCPFVPFIERRRNSRWSFTAAVSILDPASGTRIDAYTTALSPGGCYVYAVNSFTPGTKVQLRMTKDGKSVQADAVVAYADHGVGVGLTLTIIAPGHRAVLDDWLAELRGDVGPARHMPDEDKDALPSNTVKTESEHALEDFLAILMRKGLVTQEEGEPILRRLGR